jgi:hypothetical protein
MQAGVGGETRLEFNVEIQRPAVFLSGRGGSTPDELAGRFTESLDANEIQSVVEALAILQPGLETLSLGLHLPDRKLLIRAHIDGLPRPMPIALLGEGVGRLLEILLAVRGVLGGAVLIDEIGQGLYYKNLEASWLAVDKASSDSKTQVFATTHSLECVQSAVAAFKGREDDVFRMHRIERHDGEIKVVTYDQETAEAALSLGLEFR